MGALSDDQFANAVNDGGASRLLHNNEAVPTGSQSARQYAVARQGQTEKKAPIPLSATTARAHADMLRADPTVANDKAAMQGGWRGRDDDGVDKAFLDLSFRRIGRAASVEEGRANKQLAVYDLGHDRDVYVDRSTARANMKKQGEQGFKIAGQRKVGFTVEKRQ